MFQLMNTIIYKITLLNRHALSMKGGDPALVLRHFIQRISQPWMRGKNSLCFSARKFNLEQMRKTFN